MKQKLYLKTLVNIVLKCLLLVFSIYDINDLSIKAPFSKSKLSLLYASWELCQYTKSDC